MKEILNAATGKAEITLSKSGDKTVIETVLTTPPFLVQKALYTDTSFPQMAHVYIMSSAGGILQGDRLEMSITAGRGTLSRITTQAATKIYGMDSGHATQKVNITLGYKAYLEFLPLQIIPYKNSTYSQKVRIVVHDNAALVYSEVISAGRVASGERFDMDSCLLDLQIFDESGKLLATDIIRLTPKIMRSLAISSFGDKDHLGTIYLVGRAFDAEQTKECLRGYDGMGIIGFSTLPNNCGIIIRVLSSSSERILCMIEDLTSKIRKLACNPAQLQL